MIIDFLKEIPILAPKKNIFTLNPWFDINFMSALFQGFVICWQNQDYKSTMNGREVVRFLCSCVQLSNNYFSKYTDTFIADFAVWFTHCRRSYGD